MIKDIDFLPKIFITNNIIPSNAISVTYQPILLFFSYLIVFILVHASIVLLQKIDITNKKSRNIGCMVGAFLISAGIFAMHFVGMLAFKLDMQYKYDVKLMALSVVIAILFSWIVFRITTRIELTIKRLLLSALLVGLGAASMHYVGMAAMQAQGEIKYLPTLSLISFVFATSMSAAAMWIMRRVVANSSKNKQALRWLVAGIVALAVCGLQYISMLATIFIPYADSGFDPNQNDLHLAVITTLIALTSIHVMLYLYSLKWSRRSVIMLLGVLILLPFCAAVYLFTLQINNRIAFTQKELLGLRVHNGLFAVQLAAQNYRGRLFFARTTKTELKNELYGLWKKLIESTAKVDGLKDEWIALGMLSDWAAKKKQLLTAHEAIQSETPEQQFERQTEAISNLNALMTQVGNQANLILDPEIETYYMINVVVNIVPSLVESMGLLRGRLTAFFAGTDLIGLQQIRFILETVGKANVLINSYYYSITIIEQNDPEKVSSRVEEEVQAVPKMKEVFQLLDTVVNSHNKITDKRFLEATNKSINTFAEVYFRFSQHLMWHLQERLEADKDYRFRMLVLLMVSLMVTLLVFIYAEKNLIQKRELDNAKRIKAIMDTAIDGIILIDTKGKVESFNPAAERIFGYTAKEVVGQNINMLMPEPYHSEHDGYLRHYLTTGEEKVIGSGREVKAKRKDGSVFPMELGVIVFEANGEKFFSGSVRDITERKIAEQKLLLHADEMELKNSELEVARKQAEHANRMKSEFLANMSHEIRTPMNAVIGMTELLLESDLTTRQQNYARTVISSAEVLLTIINDILDFSKIESGKFELENIPFDLLRMMGEISDLMGVNAKEKAIELIFRSVPGTPTALIGDPTRIRQVVMNLVGNAIKFTEKGRVLVTVEKIQAKSDEKQNVTIRIAVEDTGIGIEKEAQARLFQKFFQADSTTTRKYGGTGLGLAISKQLVEMMGGAIGLESDVDEGATFWFTVTLPQHGTPTDLEEKYSVEHLKGAHTHIGDEDINPLDGARILLVEDNRVNREFLLEMLAGIGCLVTVAENGKVAVNKICNIEVDLILMDCQMPEMDGYQATSLMRKMSAANEIPHVPIIALTANAMKGDRERCLEAGMDDYLTKPIRKQKLVDMLLQWLKRRKS